jgi:hypothetical protein
LGKKDEKEKDIIGLTKEYSKSCLISGSKKKIKK